MLSVVIARNDVERDFHYNNKSDNPCKATCWRHAEYRREGLSTFPTFHILFLVGVAALRGALRSY